MEQQGSFCEATGWVYHTAQKSLLKNNITNKQYSDVWLFVQFQMFSGKWIKHNWIASAPGGRQPTVHLEHHHFWYLSKSVFNNSHKYCLQKQALTCQDYASDTKLTA